ncbi:MAG: MFS transporter [Pseudomonadales bacterium]|nr:MFS transporter [Pseudomonadales bacterium]MBO6565118.1 MFS transporter [Pseudomonadales bacterium]MBO6597531.1 MFS transporter [Pseudomonadales bacterium]MBO6824419.1 MFS transporter [Pseudomonadales bacterium]
MTKSSGNPGMNQQELSAASAIGALYLVRMLGLFMVLPVLPLATDDVPLATPLLIGIAIGIYGLSQGLLQIPLGFLSDRYGRKPVIAAGLMIFVIGSFVAGSAQDVYQLIIGRFLQGCGAIASTLLALMADVTRVDQRSKSMAIIGIAIAGSFGLALILGPLVAANFGVAGIFNLTGVLGILGLLLLMTRVPSPTVMANNLDSALQTGLLKTALGNPNLWRLNISILILHLLLVSGFSVFPLLLEATGEIAENDHYLYYLGLLVLSFVGMLPIMTLSDRLPDARPILLSMIATCFLGFLLLSQNQGYLAVLAGIALFFIGFNLLEVVLPAQVSKLSGAGARGTSMGVYTTCQFLGIFAGGIISGWILTEYDLTVLLSVNMVIVAIWFAVCVGFPRLGDIGSRTISLVNLPKSSAKERLEALSSVVGVLDVVVIEDEQVAYLKVDEQCFQDEFLE